MMPTPGVLIEAGGLKFKGKNTSQDVFFIALKLVGEE